MARSVAILFALLALAACGDAQETAVPRSEPGVTATVTHRPQALEGEGPPPFRLRYDDSEVVLPAFAWCYDNGCVDGDDPDPIQIGSPDEVRVFVPVKRFDLDVSFIEGRPGCGRSTPADVSKDEDGWYVVRPHGKARDYTVELFAQGRGDMVGKFRWTTTTDGKLAQPESSMALIADIDGKPGSYGLELGVSNLPSTPEKASAHITVTAGNGRSLAIDAMRERSDCIPDGTVRFNGPEDAAKQASRLGGFPFTTRVELTLDGQRHVATATFPDDVIKDYEPYVQLSFSPPLPALR